MDGLEKAPIFKALRTFSRCRGISVALLFSRCQTANADYSHLYAKKARSGPSCIVGGGGGGRPALPYVGSTAILKYTVPVYVPSIVSSPALALATI